MAQHQRLSVLGLGPAGRALAHRAAERGWSVTGIDPAGGSMPSTIGMWEREMPEWVGAEAVGKRFFPTVIGSGGHKHMLPDAYLVLNTTILKGFDGYEVVQDTADPVEVEGAVVSTVNTEPLAVRQFAYGAILPETALPQEHRIPVLMDFRDVSDGDGADTTFSYRIPLADGRWLIEETILVTRAGTAESMDLLKRNLTRRLGSLGIDETATEEYETVNFPVGPAKLRSLQGVQKFGVAGGWMHPATGYSVGSMLADVDRVLDEVDAGKPVLPRSGWPLLWLRRRGLVVLLAFDPQQTREFFDAFFTLPDRLIHNYLTGRGGVPGTAAAMVALLVPLARRAPKVLGTLLSAFLFRRL